MCHLIDFFHETLNVTWDCVCLKPNRRKDFGAEPIDSSHTEQKVCTYIRSSTPCRIGLASHTDHFTPSFFGSLKCSNKMLECQTI